MKNRHKYPDNWEDTVRPAILKRDGYRCMICGVKHRAVGYYNSESNFVDCDAFMLEWAKKQNFKIQKIHLQIMHLNHDKADVREENLQSGCPRCHLNYDRQFNTILRRMRGRQQGTNGGRA